MSGAEDLGGEGRTSRRTLLKTGAAIAALGVGSAAADAEAARRASALHAARGDGREFHQAGIATPRPTSVVLAAFDVDDVGAGELAGLLRRWTRAIRAMAAGHPSGPGDSGETDGLPPSRLTVTVGFGATLFDDRFGLRDRRPEALAAIPPLVGDALDAAEGSGDIVVQACADEATVALHAVRQLDRLAAGTARVRWLTTGFAPGRGARAGADARNVLGFRDGTANPDPGTDAFAATVWVPPGVGPAWLVGGSYLCFRKIRVDIRAWDGLTVADQQVVIGRRKRDGAPLSGGTERSPLRLAARGRDGTLAIPAGSHVRGAAPELNRGARMFRRSFTYTDGASSRGGAIDAGQLFIAWVADPRRQFIPVLQRLRGDDRLSQFTTHVASGLWAVPPAASPGGWLGEALLG